MIKINKIRIKNYKSIYDSNDILIYDRITVLAGKNESGKTNIIKALNTYYNDSFEDEDIPTKDMELNPTIIIEFSILGDYFNRKLGYTLLEDEKEYTYTIERSKNIKDKITGRLYDEIQKGIKNEIRNGNNSEVRTIIETIQELVDPDNKLDDKEFLNLLFEIYSSFIFNSGEEKVIIKKYIMSQFKIISTIKPEIENKITQLTEAILKDKLFKDINNIFNIIMPEFKFFDNFDDMIPDEISITDLKKPDFKIKNRGFINLLAFLNVTLEDFTKEMEEISRRPQTKLDKYSDNITLDYQNIYKQEKLKIALNKDGDKIYVNIYDIDDNINPKKPSQRSKGLQWFLSFYLMLNNSDENAILLIDEPGLYLHASAQEDILRLFENNLNNYIIYTTHSPYLIDTNNMLRVKLVTNDRTKGIGTCVENKYYKCADLDTITPLITAIGYNMTKSPLEFGGGLNIITEGVSDRYYILAFLKLYNVIEKVNLIPSQGARVVHLLVSIAIGWNLKYIVFLDNDQGESDARERLLNLYADENEYNSHIFKISNDKNTCIEDIFSVEDKKKYNIGKNKKEKLLIAKRFYDNVSINQIKIDDLSETTKHNIKNIIDIITEKV